MCVGCGRCVNQCPVNIDIRRVCALMNDYKADELACAVQNDKEYISILCSILLKISKEVRFKSNEIDGGTRAKSICTLSGSYR